MARAEKSCLQLTLTAVLVLVPCRLLLAQDKPERDSESPRVERQQELRIGPNEGTEWCRTFNSAVSLNSTGRGCCLA